MILHSLVAVRKLAFVAGAPAKPDHEAAVESGNEVAQSGKGVIVFVDGLFPIDAVIGVTRIAIKPRLGQQMRTGIGQDPESPGLDARGDGRDADLQGDVALADPEATAAHPGNFVATRRVAALCV